MAFHVALLSGQSCHIRSGVATVKQLRLAAQKARLGIQGTEHKGELMMKSQAFTHRVYHLKMIKTQGIPFLKGELMMELLCFAHR